MSKINKNNFSKYDFDQFSKDEDITVKKIKIESKNDDTMLKKDLVNQIYAFSGKKVIVVTDVNLLENFLIYIDKIETVTISKDSDDYKKYMNLSKVKIRKDLYNTYDNYLQKKYKININHKALDNIINYFR